MGWGIRGQYGHETGAMMAGVLVGLVLVHLFCRNATSLAAARAVALCALGVSIGGSETYGQTVGLTHDAELIGNWAALRWGLLGLALKGGIWIAFAGAFFGMGLSGKEYRPRQLAVLLAIMLAGYFLGVYLLNTPFDPAAQQLPRIYFSDDWHWEPGAALEPRPERWGGLLVALLGLAGYLSLVHNDRLAVRLAAWGFFGGAVGFAGGQCLQAWHAWNADEFRQGWFATLDPHINWWNFMETSFGLIWGAMLALGLWLHRRLIDVEQVEPTVLVRQPLEWFMVAIHVALLTAWNFAAIPLVDLFADNAITMIAIPLVMVMAGRLWPYLVTLPIVALPIAGKTLRELSFYEKVVPAGVGITIYLIVPLVVTTVAALALARRANYRPSWQNFSRPALLIATWLYFGLNYAFFRFPWPWEAWTSRTPNGIVYIVCSIILTVVALRAGEIRSIRARR
jgi:hypothetical protein